MASVVELEPAKNSAKGVPVVWGNVPLRNKNFTGRESLLTELRSRVTSARRDVTAVFPCALQGLGGAGKTHLAIEYAYRFQSDYDLVWWVPSDQPALVRSTLAALAPRLGLSDPVGHFRVEDAVSAVLEALRRGEPFARWLLIFDNADQPEMIRGLMPHGPGHVLVTSRNRRWQSMVDAIEVDVFARPESLEFLHRRVPGIGPVDADRLAEELGDLPLALEQAGSLQFETGMDAKEYLELLGTSASRLLAENPPSDYSTPLAAAWSLSVNRLREQVPFALELLRRCAFFGPEPISLDLLDRGRYVLGSDFGSALQDRLLVGRAMRELGRYALARIDNNRKTLQVHRLIQMLIRTELPPEDRERLREEVHQLLVAADPGEPADSVNWPFYAELLPHIVPSEVFRSRQAPARQLVRHAVEYLFAVGDFTTGLAEADRALARWIADSGKNDPDVLILQGIKADVLWSRGLYQDAYDLRRPTLAALTEVLGAEHEETLIVLNGHGADLRARGEFQAARDLDEDSVIRHRAIFGAEHLRTLNAANNLGVDYSLTSAYVRALELDERTLGERRDLFGTDDEPWVDASLIAVACDLRQTGRYLEARVTAEQTYLLLRDLLGRRRIPADHSFVLRQAKDLSVARRKAGAFSEALELAIEIHSRYTDSRQFGPDHPDTLAAAMNLGNALRVTGDSEEAADRIEKMVGQYRSVYGSDHPYVFGGELNLALAYRRLGRIGEAEALLKNALTGLKNRLGSDHHYTLACVTNLATVRSTLGAVDEALTMGHGALARFEEVLGSDHPHTLVCATNVALDLATVGRVDESRVLAEETMGRYRQVLGDDHPDVQAAVRGERLDLDFEPPPL